MNLVVNQSLLLLNCLERFEKQSKEIANRNELVELFCGQVVPLLAENALVDDLRKNWSLQRDQMNRRIQESEAKALEEIKETFAEVKKALSNPVNERMSSKLALIERLISGEEKWYGTPLYRILYDELKQLFEILMDAGYTDLCKNYAKLAIHKIYVQTDPNQEERWVRVLENGRTTKVLSAEELEIVRGKDEGSLLSIPPDYHLVDEIYIEEFSFAPTVLEAYAAIDAVHWHPLRHPAVIWWYFEYALWCWKTTEFYFNEVVRPKIGDDIGKGFKATCEKATWREIASVRDRDKSIRNPVIFTENLFRVGLRVLTNAINVYLSQDPVLLKTQIQPIEPPTTTLELVLDGNELWVIVTFENQATERFYVQKFHEGPDPAGSHLHQFVKEMLKDPKAGDKKAKLTRKWESASKHISRINLPQGLKREFFVKSHGSHFHFKGARLSLKSNQQTGLGLILRELRQRHLKSRKSSLNSG